MKDPLERFATKFDIDESGCWLWNAGCYSNGYPRFHANYNDHLAYRYIYGVLVEDTPDDMHIHHICETPRCVNIDHLELVDIPTHGRRHLKTHCKHGHEFTPENTYWYRDHQYCHACRSAHRWRRIGGG